MDTIAELTLELMGAQDSVTHLNESGPAHQDKTMELIARRDAIRARLHAYVGGLEWEAKVAANVLRLAAANPHHGAENCETYAETARGLQEALEV